MMTGDGGWPLSVFLTPECEPFFGGTYWPPAAARPACPASTRCCGPWPMPGKSRRQEVLRQAGRITQLLQTCDRSSGRRGTAGSSADSPVLSRLATSLDEMRGRPSRTLRSRSIREYGGFGRRRSSPSRWPCAAVAALAAHGRRRRCCRWSRPRSTAWPPAGSTTISAAASTATASTPAGWCRISRRCSTTTPCWPAGYLEAWQATGQPRYAAVVAADAGLCARRDDRPAKADSTAPRTPTAKAKRARSISGRPAKSKPCLAPRRPETFCRVLRRQRGGQLRGPQHSQPVAAAGVKRRRCSAATGAELAAELAAARQKLLAARAARVRPGATTRCW